MSVCDCEWGNGIKTYKISLKADKEDWGWGFGLCD